MRLISWNVNGLRACVQKGFENFFHEVDADCFCLQETKLQEGQIELELPGYCQFWNYAQKKGYSGTAVFTKTEPISVAYGLGIPELDTEGRLITLEYPEFYLVNSYTPNAQRELTRLDYRMIFEDDLRGYLCELSGKKPVVLCGDLKLPYRPLPSLEELEALLETAGGECTAKVLQNRHTPDAHSFIGEGKAQEVRLLIEATASTMAIFDNELSAGQIRALEEILGVTVLDRSALILDIFAQRAKTREGRLQVELAQYKYLLPRLSGMGASLSRQGGGIGTRGPGETKLESDRRHIRERITRLEHELEQVRQVRSVQRERRMKNSVPVVAIVGYTNAGKSTLLNKLTGAGIPANNRLFDTLDTTSRQLTVSDNLDVILSDTVGFIAKLPHHLVDAFRATLEELEYADLLLHVIDAADPDREAHIEVVDGLIAKLAKADTPVLKVYNKADLVPYEDIPAGRDVVAISAKRGMNMEGLLKAIEGALVDSLHHVILVLPYSMGGMVETLHNNAQVKNVEYTADGIEVETIVDDILYGRLRDYIAMEL